MDPMIALAFVAFGVGVVGVVSAWRVAAGEERVDAVLGLVDDRVAPRHDARLDEPLRARVLAPLGRGLGDAVNALLPSNWLASVRHELDLAGLRRAKDVDTYLASRAVALGVGAIFGLLMATSVGGSTGAAAGLIVAGLCAVLPKAKLSRLRGERARSIRRDLADALDLLAISVEAGAGLESGMATVTEHFDSPIGEELATALREMELGLARREALERLKRRTEVAELNNFVVALVQADALGMPLGRVLRTQADTMRMRRRQIAREAAAKLPVKMVFPLLMLILPALFIVVLGPAAITITRNLF